MLVEKIKQLANAAVRDESYDHISVHVVENIERTPLPIDINRTGGNPVGVSEANWPVFNGQKMFHVLTLDLDATPSLKSNFCENTRAISVFISDYINHQADGPMNEHAKVVCISDDSIKKGVVAANPPSDAVDIDPIPGTFHCHEIKVPALIFHPDFEINHYEKGMHCDLIDLYEQLLGSSFAGGKPLWIQPDGKLVDEQIILQFTDELVEMDMGDSGCMYVFKNTAFVQGH